MDETNPATCVTPGANSAPLLQVAGWLISVSLRIAVKFWFWFLWTIDAVVATVALYFFFSLAANGRVGSFNILPWLAILAALAAVVGGSVWLRSAGQHVVAIVVLLALAIPAVLCLLLFLLLLVLHPNFH